MWHPLSMQFMNRAKIFRSLAMAPQFYLVMYIPADQYQQMPIKKKIKGKNKIFNSLVYFILCFRERPAYRTEIISS